MPGITSYGAYVPYYRLTRKAMGGGKGERAIASFDEDAVSMAVEASRDADLSAVDTLLFATTSPPYAEKLNAAAIAAALSLPSSIRSTEIGSSSRMGLGALLMGADAAAAGRHALVCVSDVVVGAPSGSREKGGGDAAVAFVTGPDDEAIARFVGQASATTELLDVWRLPGEKFANQWEERFGAEILGPISNDTAKRALEDAGVQPSDLAAVVLDATNKRDVAGIPRALGLQKEQLADMLEANVGRTGAAHAGLVLARVLDSASPGDKILVVSTCDGCDAAVLEVTDKITAGRPKRSVDRWIASARNDIPYNTYLKWREILPFEPPRRPDLDRPAAPPMQRNQHWKYGFYGSRCTECQSGYLPPQQVCLTCGSVNKMQEEAFADVPCKIKTYTFDHLAYTLQPPVVSTVVDFQGGGRLTCEMADVDPASVKIGDQLEMTSRRLYTGSGVHNYFWKARPQR
ncbi:MAG TPA: hydroxymethylglutaryl-CoA synthase [Gammaproteobacteria bacterium]|nr:hydroxymethylglutaryl-CoA synthase [Gammaproteobacteria bacterium]